MPPYTCLYLPAIFAIGIAWWLQKARQLALRRRGRPYPPGPNGCALIGSLPSLPLQYPWLVYDEWFKVYGDMIYFEVLGQPFLLLGAPGCVQDIFEKRSANYSDRPPFIMLNDMMGWSFNFALMPYGSWWRRNRRSFHQYFNTNQVLRYNDIQTTETHAFLRRLLDTPQDFMDHSRHLIGAIIMKISYGISVQEKNDPYIHNAEEAMVGATEAGVPGRFLVELLPILKRVPRWFPGAGWKKWAEYYDSVNKLVTDLPFEHVKQNMKTGTAVPCIATSLIEELPSVHAPNRAEEEEIAKNTVAAAYSSASDTLVSTINSFFLAMCCHPEAQKRAQEELDTVLGGRLPEYEDRGALPYINAMVKESLRWHLVIPLIPHWSINDDEYNGYFIPKGTVVIGSAWTILHDPKVYPEPSRYMPERFLKNGQLDPDARDPTASSGFGRRVCAGRFITDQTLFIAIASILAAFHIGPESDQDGKIVPVEPKFSSGLVSHPEPFRARITPRSKKIEMMLRNSELG